MDQDPKTRADPASSAPKHPHRKGEHPEHDHLAHGDRPLARIGRGMPRAVQLLLVAVGFAIVLAVFVIGPAASHVFGLGATVSPAGEPAADTGSSFKITDRQWAALKVQPVANGTFENSAATDGKIALDDDLVTPVFSPYTGRVTRLMARAGDSVALGTPLFAVQATELAQAQNDLITAASNLRTVRAQLNLAETNEKRQHALYTAQGTALKDWQQSQVDLATAQGSLNTAQIALGAVRSRLRILGKSDADIEAIERAPDPLHLSADTMVRAPIGGTVVTRQVGLGQNIVSASSGASSPVFMIGDVSRLWLVANAREQDAPLLHTGDPVEVRVLAFPNRVFKARLAYVAASLDPITHRLPVRAEVDNLNGLLKPEMFASFRIITGAATSNPSVPESAVVYEGDTAHVWIADGAAKTLAIRPVRLGYQQDGQIQVLEGLKPGEEIVTSGAVFIDRAIAGD